MNRASVAEGEGIGVVLVVVGAPGVAVPHATTANLVVDPVISEDGQQATAAADLIPVVMVAATPVVAGGVVATGGNHWLITNTPPVRCQLSITVPFLSPTLVCFPFMQVDPSS